MVVILRLRKPRQFSIDKKRRMHAQSIRMLCKPYVKRTAATEEVFQHTPHTTHMHMTTTAL